MTPFFKPRKPIVLEWPQIFDSAVERLLNSPNEEERKSLFVGISQHGGHPFLTPRSILIQNGHILGDPGSNKTSKGIAPTAAQLIASGECSVAIIDPKPDLALFHGARIEAERAGLPFKAFTTRPGWESNVFNPLAQSYLARANRGHLAEHQISALGLNYGQIYGGEYFSSRMELFLRNILYRYGDSITSLTELYRFCADQAAYKRLGPASDWEQSRHLHAVLCRLASSLELNASHQTYVGNKQVLKDQIQIEQFLTEPTVLYFAMQSILSPTTAQAVPRLFLYGVLAAKSLLMHERRTVDTFIFVDEAQTLVSASLPTVVAQCRGHGLGVILAHQSLDQLKAGDLDLTQIMLSTTAFKQVFRASDLVSRDYLARSGGEARYHDFSWTQQVPHRWGSADDRFLSTMNAPRDILGLDPVLKINERVGPFLDPNTIMENSASSDLSLVNITEDRGFANYRGRWTPVLSGYHITKEEYEARSSMPWPKGDPGKVVVPLEWDYARRLEAPPVPIPELDDLNIRVKKRLSEK